MTAMLISQAQRRLIVFASTAFFMMSVYLCTTRLFAMDYTRDNIASPQPHGSGAILDGISSSTPKTGSKTDILHAPPPDIDIELERADLPMSYGRYGRPPFEGITLIAALADQFVPTLANRRRLIVIGDVHGMIDPLNALLEQAKYDPTYDHVVSVGDMVNKGPKSAAVVARFIELNATAVRGNHEDRVLLAWDAVAARRRSRGQPGDLEWLRTLPVILTVDPLNLHIVHAGLVPGVELKQQDPWAVMNMRTLVYPREEFRKSEIIRKKKALEKARQKEEEDRKKKEEEDKKKKEAEAKEAEAKAAGGTAVTKRSAALPRDEPESDAAEAIADGGSLDEEVRDHDIWIPIDTHDGDRWTDLWNRGQRRVHGSQRLSVVYGHDAKRGYHEDAYTFGLDSGCQRGGALSAFIIEAVEGEGMGWKHTTVQVPCIAQ
ncbi:hypothetical protein G7046_g4657 [Stylonectria norvegica]|nr:hypothetical protein G7046_g4657 [Stylonectria norvegica]